MTTLPFLEIGKRPLSEDETEIRLRRRETAGFAALFQRMEGMMTLDDTVEPPRYQMTSIVLHTGDLPPYSLLTESAVFEYAPRETLKRVNAYES